MARIRTIKPEFWTSEQITECSVPARLLFLGLLNFADDGGRMPLSLKRIKGQIFPHDDFVSADIRRMLDELCANTLGTPLVAEYDIGGQRFLEITGFSKHQKVDWATFLYPDRTGVVPENIRAPGRGAPRSFAERSQDVPPRKGGESKGKEGNGKEGNGREESPRKRAPPSLPPSDDWPDDYRDQFARLYPQKVRMAAALDVLEGVRAGGKVTWRFLMEQLAAYAGKSDDAYWASPTNWLKEERWNDQPASPPQRPVPDAGKRRTLAGRAAERAREMEAGDCPPTPCSPSDEIGGAEIGGDHARVLPAASGE